MAGVDVAIESPDQAAVIALIAALDAYQLTLYPPECVYSVDIATLCGPETTFFVARDQTGVAVGCAAILVRSDYAELKRMYVIPTVRGTGCGSALLAAAEAAALRHGLNIVRLETGPLQPEALALYQRCGYRVREAFADYPPDPSSVFMEKTLASPT